MNGLSYFSPNYPVHITPLVSVVLIARRVYDCEKCLDTLMKQSTTFETEVIVVDRSSTDEIERLCRRYTSFYPHRLRYRRNPERYIAFGSPGAEVRSRYVIVCRDYERWNDSGKLQRQGEYLREHPSCALCFHNVEGDVSLQHYEERGYEMGDLDFLYLLRHYSPLFRLEGTPGEYSFLLYERRGELFVHRQIRGKMQCLSGLMSRVYPVSAMVVPMQR